MSSGFRKINCRRGVHLKRASLGVNLAEFVLGSHSWAMNLGEYYRPFLHPGHIVCRLCEADGLSECTMLHGIAAIDRVDAYHFAASRSGQRVLIDASKRLDWSRDFLGRSDIDARLIHLVRHPCGFVEFEGRRLPIYRRQSY